MYFKENIYIIKTLKEFQYVDDQARDEGANVRQKAKDITNLLQDDERLRNERRNHASMHGRLGRGDDGEFERAARIMLEAEKPRSQRGGLAAANDEDEEMRKAIAASKKTAAEEQIRQREESEMEKALRLSREEEAKRLKSLEDANSSDLFDESTQP